MQKKEKTMESELKKEVAKGSNGLLLDINSVLK